jgi:photosystem II stability/assembly factor-like uncharacterized protein
MLKIILVIFVLFISLFSQSDTLKPDYRNRINIPEYDPSLMPLNYNNRSTGVWTELNPNVPRVDYLSIDFVGADTGWAVGANGAIIKTTDAGNKWKTIQSNITNVLLNLNSFNGNVVIITGYDGVILRSIDGGESFVQVTSGVGNGIDLWGLKMINDSLGWICGLNNTLLRTIDAGVTWQNINTGFTGYHYWNIDFYNEDIGYITGGNGRVLKTVNGGLTWEELYIEENKSLYAIYIKDSSRVAVGGQNGRTAYTSNGGINWTLGYAGSNVNSISFANDTLGYAVGDGQYWYYRTTDGGISWQWNSKFATGEFCVKFINEDIGYEAGKGLTINKTFDGGYNWEKNIWNDNFSDVHFLNETTGFAISGSLYKTTTGGLSWTRIENAPGGNDILFLDSLTGFIGGSQSLFKTTDGGANWYATIGIGGVKKIFFVNNIIGWAVGGNNIYKTTNGGENWIIQQTSSSFQSIHFVDSLYGWAARINGRPFKTTDGGANWVEQTNLNIWESDDIYFYDYLKGWIIGGNKLYYTTNSGNEWIQDLQIYTYSRNFEKISNNHFIITGTNIYESVDTGHVWQNITFQVGSYFTTLHAPTNYSAYGVGPLGYILSYLDTTIVPVELISFSLEQIDNKILITWTTATETNNNGFEVFRSKDLIEWESIGFVQGNGSTTSKSNYTFSDTKLSGARFYYKLKQIDYDGSYEFSEIVSIDIFIDNYFLYQNYPNPANPTTSITFSIPQKTNVKIEFYQITGEKIKEIINEEKDKGIYKIDINLSNYASGIYFYKMITKSGYTATKKIVLIK